MLAEFNVFGIYIAPLVVYGIVAFLITIFIRWVLWKLGALQWFWHVALFEVALYCAVLSLLILYL